MMLAASALGTIVRNANPDVHLDWHNRLGLQPLEASAGPSTARPVTVKPTRATVFSPGGGADNPRSAGLAIEGNPAISWSTDTYFDPVPFPAYKPGVGLLLRLPRPTILSAVTVDVSSTGTVVQIRAAPLAPTALAPRPRYTQATTASQ